MEWSFNKKTLLILLGISSAGLFEVRSQPLTNAELEGIIEREGEGVAVERLHEQTSQFLQSYLQMLKSGDVFGAVRASYLEEGESDQTLRTSLEEVYKMSTMTKWSIVSGWPFFTDDGTPGFVYKVRISYPESHYFVLTGVIIKNSRLGIVGSMAPEHLWPAGFRTPSVDSPEDFAVEFLEE